jgi:hypothetical protein
MLLLDQPAKVDWVDGTRTAPDGKILPNSKNKDFESVRSAIRFIMETMNEGNRHSALIHTNGATLHQADIEAMYATLK